MTIPRSSLAAIACTLIGCAAPKPAVVEEPKAPSVKAETDKIDPAPKLPADDFRTGDLLVLPKETEYRATNPTLPKSNSGPGAVIVTPPKSKPEGKPGE
jgi:hypothetical protein